MKIIQVNFKTQGGIENFQILKTLKSENSIDYWTVAIEATKNERNNYELKLNGQKFIVFNDAKVISKYEKVYAQDIDNAENKFISKNSFSDMFFTKEQESYFRNNENYYKLSSVPSGTKGYIYPITRNNKPVAVLCQSNTGINGNLQMSLYTMDPQIVDEVITFFIINYISFSPEFLDLGFFSSKNTWFYSFYGRKSLTKIHMGMLPKNRRPSKIEAGLWVGLGLLLIIAVTFINPVMGIIFISMWIIISMVK